MSSIVNTLLEELYALEPSLRTKETAVRGLLEAMIASEPHIEIDETFRAELRAKIMQEVRDNRKPSWNWWPMMSVACFCLVVGVWFSLGRDVVNPTPLNPTPLVFENTIQNVENNAFDIVNTSWPKPVTRPQSGGGGGGGSMPAMAETTRLGNSEAISSKMMAPDTMIYPPIDFPVYTYSYKGDIQLPETSLPVYKKSNVSLGSDEASRLLWNLSLRGVNMSAFENLGITNLTLTEDTAYGYMVNLDFASGNISMYQNYQKWPQPVCDNTGCTTLPPLTEADIPSDESIVAVAEAFIAKYGIDKSVYGTPKIDNSWKIWYARSAEMGSEQMVPEVYTITYPILMDGKPVYQEGGMYRGLTLNYDVRSKRISNMYGIEKTKLEKSNYDTIQDTKLINDMIKSGGRYITTEGGIPPERKVVDVELSEPSMGYVHLFGEWKNGTSQEYFVPAYIFAVENPPKEGFSQNTIIVPLVKEFTQTVHPMPVDPIVYSTEPVAEPAVMPKQ
jgi:hypothetical protein